VTGAKLDKMLAKLDVDYYDEMKNTPKNNEPDDDGDDDEEEEIVPDTRQTLIEPSPVFLPVQYDTDHLHRHHRRDESVLNNPKSVINSTPVQVNNFINRCVFLLDLN